VVERISQTSPYRVIRSSWSKPRGCCVWESAPYSRLTSYSLSESYVSIQRNISSEAIEPNTVCQGGQH